MPIFTTGITQDSDKKETNYKIKQTQQVTVPSSEEIIASCNNIILYQFPEANSTDIFIVYIFTYVIILSCLYAFVMEKFYLRKMAKKRMPYSFQSPQHIKFSISKTFDIIILKFEADLLKL
jgi:hypothetical protein